MLRPARSLVLSSGIALAVLAGSCAAPPAEGEPQIRVRWGALGDPTAEIPSSVEALLLLVYLPDAESPEDSAFTIGSLEDMDANGRLELTRTDLPFGEPVRLVLLGGPADNNWTHMGSVGPIVLERGERRYVDIRMYGLVDSNAVDGGEVPSARFLHTATALNDGRVLIAGGFERATMATCPAGAATGSSCYELVAANDAFVFEPSSSRFYEVQSPMLAARGGHTASLLPDGRVLVAGGAGRALLVATPTGTGTNVALSIVAGTDVTTPATYEIFEPEANPEEEDVDADGDPGRGGFLGSADAPSRAGALDLPRLLHSAVALDDGRVMIAGGVSAPGSYTVWDPARAGGYGVVGTGALPTARPAPGAAVLGSGAMQRVLVAGGGEASTDGQLADVWIGTGGAIGSATSANIMTAAGSPQWNLYRPIVETIGSGQGALVLGWYGPWCPAGMNAPTFTVEADSTRCAYGVNRAFTFEVATNRATGTATMRQHAFGASTRLDDGTIAVTGGVSELTLDVNTTIDFYGTSIVGGAAQLVATSQTLRQRRALHAMAALPDGGFLVFGGATFSADGRGTITPVAAPEVLFVQRARGR
ncbi:MAG: hypothetical protein J0L92_13975 [Deltaproteobacteria bacterium]|nr:hypothetical protein [Deltaproteobacteria bacterium]